MKHLLCYLLSLWVLLSSTKSGAEEIWSTDKGYHLGVSYALGTASYGGLWCTTALSPGLRLPSSIGLALIPGLAKEIYDASQPDNHFSGLDMMWNVVGAASGALTLWAIERLFFGPSPSRQASPSPSRLLPQTSPREAWTIRLGWSMQHHRCNFFLEMLY